MEVLTGIELGSRSRVGNGWTKSRVLTSNGYRSWMAELDQRSSKKKVWGKFWAGDRCSTWSSAVVQLWV